MTFINFPAWAGFVEKAPLSYESLPVHIDSPVMTGSAAKLYARRCNKTNTTLSYFISRYLIKQDTREKILLPEAFSSIPPGCESIESRLNIIPEDLKPGTYILYGISQVHGKFNDFLVEWYSDPFEVVLQDDLKTPSSSIK